MGKNPTSLFSQLISPLGTDKFFSDYFEDKHYYSSKSEIDTNFNIGMFECLLWSHNFDNPENIQVNKSGKSYTFNKEQECKNHFDWLMDRYREGCTLIFNGIDKIVPEISLLARSLDLVFKGKTTINAFLTPAGSKGFLPHFDTHDVFILQTEGTKEWTLYDKQIDLPLDRQIYLIDQQKLSKPSKKYRLAPGSVLYIPRGLVHGSFTGESHSLHLTIGVRPLLAEQYLTACIEILSEQETAFRKSILGNNDKQRALLIRKLAKLLESKSESIYFNKLVNDRIELENISRIKPFHGHRLQDLNDIEKLSPDSKLVKMFYGNDLLVDHEDKIRLTFPGIGLTGEKNVRQGYIEMPAISFGAIDFIQNREGAFTAKDLPEIYPMETKLMLLKTMLKNGYLKFH